MTSLMKAELSTSAKLEEMRSARVERVDIVAALHALERLTAERVRAWQRSQEADALAKSARDAADVAARECYEATIAAEAQRARVLELIGA